MRCAAVSLVLVLASVRVALVAAQSEVTPDDVAPSAVDNVPVDVTLRVDGPGGADRNPNALQRLQRFWNWSDARVRGVFEYILPDTLEKSTWRLSLQPRLGDILHHDHIRLPMSVNYGFNRRIEGEVGLDPYFPNPFQGDSNHSGSANVRAGLKVQWEPGIDNSVRAATGVKVVNPLSSAPFEFNDGINRYTIFQSLARPSPWNPNLEGFVNLSYDFITPSSAEGDIDEDDPQNDFYQIGAGWLLRKKGVTYGLAFGYAHTTDGVQTSFTTVTPSVIFDVPSRYTFRSPGQWQLGAALEAKRYGDENALDFKVRVRWNVDFRKVMRDWSDARAKARLQASSRQRTSIRYIP